MEVIDSCATNNGGCDHDCKHGVRGPICSCHKGYMLQADARTCEGEFGKRYVVTFNIMVLGGSFAFSLLVKWLVTQKMLYYINQFNFYIFTKFGILN